MGNLPFSSEWPTSDNECHTKLQAKGWFYSSFTPPLWPPLSLPSVPSSAIRHIAIVQQNLENWEKRPGSNVCTEKPCSKCGGGDREDETEYSLVRLCGQGRHCHKSPRECVSLSVSNFPFYSSFSILATIFNKLWIYPLCLLVFRQHIYICFYCHSFVFFVKGLKQGFLQGLLKDLWPFNKS